MKEGDPPLRAALAYSRTQRFIEAFTAAGRVYETANPPAQYAARATDWLRVFGQGGGWNYALPYFREACAACGIASTVFEVTRYLSGQPSEGG